MNAVNRPVSEIIKHRDVEEPKKRSREDWRKAKELEEARKAGTAPAAVDEEGKDINPHIPQYIASAPWYFGASTATLKHQRPQADKQKQFNRIEEYYERGRKGGIATHFRPGSCENCGALTHKKKDCLERPRKCGAKYTGEDFAPDEVIHPDLDLDYDGKRDVWNGYDPENYHTIVEEYAKVEETKRQLKEDKLKQDMVPGEASGSKEQADLDDDDDEEKYADNADMPGTKVDSKQRITVRNLRIREDVAKYLRNLDPNSAYYDPKTRAMRENPYKSTGKTPEELNYAGDNFVRCSGDTQRHGQTQSFAWQAYEKGVDVHLLAEPTKAELLHKEFQVKKEEFKHSMKDGILDKYGGEEHLKVPPKELIFAQTEDYVEYSRQGQVIKGTEKAIVRSKYEEDVYINNHTSVWGSFWQDHRWGYKCCHSFLKNSYCTGGSGKEAVREASRIVLLPPDQDEDYQIIESPVNLEVIQRMEKPKALIDLHMEKLALKRRKRKEKRRKHKKEKRLKKISESKDSSDTSDTSDEEIMIAKRLEKASRVVLLPPDQDEEDQIIESPVNFEVIQRIEKPKALIDLHMEKLALKRKKRKERRRKYKKEKRLKKILESEDSSDTSDEEILKAKRLEKALIAEEENQKEADRLLAMDERKRPYNSMYEAKAPTEEEMEAYFLKRQRPDDPMAGFLSGR